MPEGYKARPEQVILFTVAAWDSNCPQHIPQRFEAADVAAALASRDRRIAELEAEIARLKEAGKVNTVRLTTPAQFSSAPDLATRLGRSPTSFSTSSPARSARVERRVST